MKKLLIITAMLSILLSTSAMAAIFAEDTDGGWNFYTAGVCIEYHWWGQNFFDDVCIGRNHLMEYYVFQFGEYFECQSVDIYCSNGCSHAACR